MSLDHAILGFLQYEPLSGYDLKARFDVSVQHFWPADQSQIYRTLAKLAEEGFARVEIVEQEERPDRKVYHLTEAGRAELRRWLSAPLEMKAGRSAPLVQVFFSGQLADEEILGMFRRAAAECRDSLRELQRVPAEAQPFTAQIKAPRETWCWFLTLECGRRVTEARLAWLEDVMARIERGEIPRKGEKEEVTCKR
jgi:DNA-binding PadR family transcriptional regulator